MKRCYKCNIVKPLEDFYRSSRSSDGRCDICALCEKEKFKKRYAENHAKELERSRTRRRNPRSAAHSKSYYFRVRKHARSQTAIFKHSVRQQLRDAVASGEVIKPGRCEECLVDLPVSRIHGHHEDYSKPLEVKWLCSKCHGIAHRIDLASLSLKVVVE